jgi:hypothetical protein
MKDILVVAKLKEGKFEKFMGFMKSQFDLQTLSFHRKCVFSV